MYFIPADRLTIRPEMSEPGVWRRFQLLHRGFPLSFRSKGADSDWPHLPQAFSARLVALPPGPASCFKFCPSYRCRLEAGRFRGPGLLRDSLRSS
jgi:hypothetical protein